MIWCILAAIIAAALAGQPADRLDNATQVLEQPANSISVGGYAMPWVDYRHDTTNAQAAIDACDSWVWLYSDHDWEVFAAHNQTCPTATSGRHSLTATEIWIDGQRHVLAGRRNGRYWELLGVALHRNPPVAHGDPAVILQTSIGGSRVRWSWFIHESEVTP